MKRRHFSVLFTEKVEKKVASLDSVVEHFVYLAVIICKREKKKKKKIFGLGQTRFFLNPQRTYVIKFKRAPFSLLMVTKVMSVINLFNNSNNDCPYPDPRLLIQQVVWLNPMM